jgi:hypothetical protein
MSKWQSKLTTKERMLLVGGPGSGKSWGAYQIATRMPHTYVIDNDFSWPKMMELHPSPGTITLFDLQPDDWAGIEQAFDFILDEAGPDDLLVLDSMTPTWPAVQDWYTNEFYSKGLDEFFIEARKNGKDGVGLDGWKDWSVINKKYGQLYRNINRFPGHVVLTAEAEPLGDGADPEMRRIFGRVKPRGQKSMAHKVDTILLMTNTAKGYEMRPVKDRGRELGDAEPVSDLFMSYMVARAGWTKA